VIEQSKREALKILFNVRPFDSNPFDSSRNALQVSNAELVEIVADNLQTFAEIVALLEEAQHQALKIEQEAEGRSVQAQEVE
jgi:TusA-related sulfurtransferase